MNTPVGRPSLAEFRATYAEIKPHFELFGGEAVQKVLPTEYHSVLQFVLCLLLRERGYKARPEMTVGMDECWELTPDVCGLLEPIVGHRHPTRAVAVVVEILVPDDRFTYVMQKCSRYAEWGVPDILVFDPLGRHAWYWDGVTESLSRFRDVYRFRSRGVVLPVEDVFRRLAEELR